MWIHSKLQSSSVNGPGNRAVVFVQGCSLACPGCWNPSTHPVLKDDDTRAGERIENHRLAEWVVSLKGTVEGVTLSGGEPLQQSHAVADFCWRLKELWPEVSIGLFTGLSLKEVESKVHLLGGVHWEKIKSYLDFAVMGRYVQSIPSTKPLCSSSNQKVMFFTNRYSHKDLAPQQMELQISESGLVEITGFPNKGLELGREF